MIPCRTHRCPNRAQYPARLCATCSRWEIRLRREGLGANAGGSAHRKATEKLKKLRRSR